MAWIPTHQQYHQVLECKWEPTDVQGRMATIMSKMIKYRGEKLFRAGLKNQQTSSILFFMTFDLAKIGIHDVIVLYKSPTNERKIMVQMTEESSFLDPRPVQLYTLQLDNIQAGNLNLSYAFEVYIGNSELYHYPLSRYDGLLGRQLWSASIQQLGTNYELVAEGRRFYVHKFILAARSPVFASIFLRHPTQEELERSRRVRRMNFQDAATLRRFLKFLYTGELEGPVSQTLLELARKYKVAGLKRVCKKGLPERENMVAGLANLSLLLNMNPGVQPETRPITDLEMVLHRDTCIFSFTWDVPSENTEIPLESDAEEVTRVSGAFITDSGETFSAKVILKRHQQMAVSFLVHQDPQKSSSRVDQVSFTLDDDYDYFDMQPSANRAANRIKLFTKTISPVQDFPDSITFYVRLVSKIPNFNYSFRDSLFGDRLWAGSLNGRFTDVELIVGLRTFSANRALLSARSPVFSAMFNAGMEEARNGRVQIDGVDPDVFDHFLRFLYTGGLDSSDVEMRRKVYDVADRYQVETLMQICQTSRAVVGPVNVENMMDAFLSV